MSTEEGPRRAELSYDIRLLVCRSCGAPYESAADSTSGTCSHCGATHALVARDETPQRVRGAATDDEERRIATLRAQLPGRIVVPQSLAKIAMTAVYTDEDRATIRRVWDEARDTIVAGKRDDGWELALYSATWFHFSIQMNADLALRRALAESALELLEVPKYRHSLRCKLRRAAHDRRPCPGGRAHRLHDGHVERRDARPRP
jgi:DNA-directed RNA polymerase subunit RPC12/RpoP